MKRYAKLIALTLLAGAVAFPAFAQSDAAQGGGMMQGGMGMQGMGMKGMKGMGMKGMMGMHTMNATVTAVDAKTGLIDASAGDMRLKLHFPPASLAGLKSGDKITLHMGFTKP